ncbi:amidohydrolase [Eilatimonas milleporae]|uniref:Hippurate hydrolase n=1 Tax=Eilatimonas milleporae TaxID=911205 RepID=A0A3M0BW73_9PROT|nr:amidohydrolase [Eilatimonas milleporae]RMB01844.1 hippurate hydrolase [Eilatimonas milleporae]
MWKDLKSALLAGAMAVLPLTVPVAGAVAVDDLRAVIAKDYDDHLEALFKHFHANPELSLQEHKTAARLAAELRDAGFEVTEGIGQTGLVAIMENGPGPRVMMRADMDGLPVLEKSGLDYASTAMQTDPNGIEVPVMHACGHDVHITALVGTARRMAAMRDTWSGTLMLIGQPAEERFGGARIMREDRLYERFGKPDYGLAFHVNSLMEAGKIWAADEAAYAGVDSVNITVHGLGAHGAAPHAGKDPIVLGAQIVTTLQTLISRELSPRVPGVVTVGSFHGGTKHNIIPDEAKLQITVRSDDSETRETLLSGIRRIAENLGRASGLPDDMLPTVEVLETETYPPTRNDPSLARRLKAAWRDSMGAEAFADYKPKTMGAEDFPFLVTDLETYEPIIPSVYFAVGGTPAADFERAEAGGPPIPSHHSPLFKIVPQPSVVSGVEATVVALMDLMPKD